ncbi:nitrogenase component 1 [Pectinatus haikarae]|uniref:Nitrogenase molybdenum-iron protein beta chain n=1 Tax=Pectinatus haikarae TaxID=349096 RepID=A0ABT9Y9W0_9FIRM|nr:nitrogenase component 1 [Pectinatus haikarae]MDQ0204519.1 nitrogenase molybdenum-iron protein beta chain [Pectinatus haikarae]
MSEIIEQPRYGCALSAQQTVLAIPRALPIIHAGPGCASKAFSFAATGAGFQGEGYGGGSHISSTNTGESEVIFGGEPSLEKEIKGALKILDGDLFVVLSGCTSDIVGDDSISVAERFAAQGYPVVGTETAGFKGSSYYGHEIVVKSIIEQFIGDVKPQVRHGLVNVFAVVPFQDPFWRGDLEEIKRILTNIGLEVNILFGNGSAGISEWRDIPNAQFNLLISPSTGTEIAELLEAKYQTPYLQYPILPVGGVETSRFLREVAAFAGLSSLPVEKAIEKEERRFYDYFVAVSDFIGEYWNNLPVDLYAVGDSIYAPGVSSFLVNELGLVPRGVYVTDEPQPAWQSVITETLAARDSRLAAVLKFENDGGAIEMDIREKDKNAGKSIILGSSWEKFLAVDVDSLYAYLSLPLDEIVILNHSYMGYSGGLRLIEEVYSAVFKRKTATSRSIV